MRRSRSARRRGAAVVEFAVVAPVLILFVFGVIEFGRVVMVHQTLTSAAREGARRAVLEQTTAEAAKTFVSDYLASTSVRGASVTVSPIPLTSAGFGDPVTVRCEVEFNRVSWLPSPWFLEGKSLSAEVTMKAERPE